MHLIICIFMFWSINSLVIHLERFFIELFRFFVCKMLMISKYDIINNKYFSDALTLFIRLFTSAARYQLS